ncbi:MAG: C4-dicarboxylate TRAP transporter substrate-binding protein [Betaproteobacteria bacterium]|jgi:TRAP-type C4-dicarboxylate transport system substrate-binding protein|nr:C4-dicarboxylate TRAP transporter substrate-binding protein [Betaproteobacteria bacterium]
MKRIPRALRVPIVALALAALPVGANAQQVIKLTAIDGYPPRALWTKLFISYYIPEVDKRLAASGKYKIEWQQAWGGQIVKPRGVLDGIKNKLGDIGIVTTVFHASKLPLNNLPYYTPFSSRNPKIVSRIIDELMEKYPAFQKQFDAQNQVALTNFSSIDNYGVFTKEPAPNVSDLKGRKLLAAGPNALYMKAVGAVTVLGSLTSYYNDMKSGVADGCVIWPEATITFKLVEVAPYYMETDFGTGVNKSVTVNKEVWASLPPDVQKVLKEVAVDYRDTVAQAAIDLSDVSIKKFKAAGGKIHSLTEAQKKEWADSMPNIAMNLAEDVEKNDGYPAKQILSAYMSALRAAGQKPIRNWDQK